MAGYSAVAVAAPAIQTHTHTHTANLPFWSLRILCFKSLLSFLSLNFSQICLFFFFSRSFYAHFQLTILYARGIELCLNVSRYSYVIYIIIKFAMDIHTKFNFKRKRNWLREEKKKKFVANRNKKKLRLKWKCRR